MTQTAPKQKRYAFDGLTSLRVPVPPMLEQALGYPGSARFVSFHWTPSGDEADYDDGQRSGTGNWQGFLAFVQHPIVHPFLTDYDLGSSESDARHALILDRHERKLSIASITDADTFLAQQWPKLPAVHLTREEWEALQTKVITTMKRKEQLIDMEEIHRRIEAQYAVVEALQHWLNQFLAN
jgi:hypothetical protein